MELLNEFRRQIDQENVFTIHGFNYLYDSSIIEKIIYFLERISYRIKKKIPSKKKNLSNYRDSVLVIRSARNQTGFSVIQSLKEDYDIDIIFASWNSRLKTPVKKLNLNYIQIQDVFGKDYEKLINRHHDFILKLLTKEKNYAFSESFSKIIDFDLSFGVNELLANLLSQSRACIDIYEHLFNNIKPKGVILLGELTMKDRTAALLAKRNGIKSFFIQHGLLMGNVYRNLATDYACVWGKIPMQFWLKKDVAKERVYEFGHFGFDGIPLNNYSVKKIPNKNPRVLIIGQNPKAFLTMKEHSITLDVYEKTIREMEDITFIIKPHPGESQIPYFSIFNRYNNVIIETKKPINECIIESDIVITIFSTAGLEAMMFKRPVIVLSVPEIETLAPYHDYTYNASDEKDLNYCIKNLLQDMKIKEDQIQKGSNYLANYCGEISGSSKNAAKMIKNVISNTN